MHRKIFRRRRRLVIGLAFAALALPTSAQAVTGGFYTDGPPRGVNHTDARDAALRTTDLGPLDGWAYGVIHRGSESTVTPLQADGMRAQGIANVYQKMAASNLGPLDGWAYGLVHRSTGPTVTGLQAEGQRLQGIAKVYENMAPRPGTRTGNPTQPASPSSFNWSDAGVGASVAFGVALLLVLSVAIGRRRHTRSDRTGLASA